jgi:plastocyanin
MPEEPQETIIDQLFHILEQLVLPNWSDLIALLPWVLIALVVLYLAHTALQWRRASEINRPRVPPRRRGGAPPPGIHMPGPSRWPFVVPIGLFLLLLSLAPSRNELNEVTAAFHPPVFAVGALVTLVAIAGWLWDAMREWRATAREAAGGDDHGVLLTSAGAGAMALPHGGYGAGVASRAMVVAEPEFVAVEPPPGVHMPGPSPWPFFAPIALTLMLFGMVFSAVLIVAGLVLGVIAAGGWLRDAGREYRSTEAVGHAIPETRDPSKAWPKRLVPIFASVIAIAFLVTLAPIGLGYLNGLTPASATPGGVEVPEVPELSASTAVSFDTGTLVVPAGRPFDLVFDNNHDGVPHNVQIADSSARTTVIFDGTEITGVASTTYNVPPIPEGDYYFLCRIHPNMHGTVQSRPEAGAPTGPGGSGGPGASQGPGAAPSP